MNFEERKIFLVEQLNSLFDSDFNRDLSYEVNGQPYLFIVNDKSVNDIFVNKDYPDPQNWPFDNPEKNSTKIRYISVSLTSTQLNELYTLVKAKNDHLWDVYQDYLTQLGNAQSHEDLDAINFKTGWE